MGGGARSAAPKRPALLGAKRAVKQARHAGPIILIYYRTLAKIRAGRRKGDSPDEARRKHDAALDAAHVRAAPKIARFVGDPARIFFLRLGRRAAGPTLRTTIHVAAAASR